ncbi:MAG TPA: hypothetical protein VJ919_09330 [Tangfeifania sp.]|nr:hypothetical protein [Tangfeifania sp.]
MGIERDYLMRQLMMLFEVIQKILGYRKKGDKKQALQQINYFYTCLKIDEDVRSKSIEEFLDFLVGKKKLTNEQIEMVAIVLTEQGELAEEMKEKTDFFRKSYFLLDKVERESTSFSMERQMKLSKLREYLN